MVKVLYSLVFFFLTTNLRTLCKPKTPKKRIRPSRSRGGLGSLVAQNARIWGQPTPHLPTHPPPSPQGEGYFAH